MNRRNLLGALASLGAVATAMGKAGSRANSETGDERPVSDRPAETRSGDMLYRTLGKTGVQVSVIGLGGSHLGGATDANEAARIVRTGVDRGITFLDNSWDYHGGQCEEWMGNALREGYRAKVFLMTKFDGRTREAAARQIDESLKRLRTDHVDLLQFHENIRLEDPDRFFAPGGAVEALRDAQQSGKTRFVGFTGHKDPSVHLRMLDLALAHDFHFDTCQMPVNIMDAQFRSFTLQVLPRLLKEGIAVLGMKPMGSGNLLKSKAVTAVECLHFALSQPVSVVITGVESMERLDQALDAVKKFKPLGREEIDRLLARTREAAATGQFAPFKTSNVFDGTAQHPEWLG